MKLANIIFLAAMLAASSTRAEGPVPLPPPVKQCKCPAGYDRYQSAACCIRLSWPEECSPCLNGCKDSTCLDKPYVDEDGFPLSADDAICSVVEIDGDIIGECDAYAWTCDDAWCSDSDGVYWRVPAPDPAPTLPAELSTPDGDEFPGCTTTRKPGGCTIKCDNGFIAGCVAPDTSGGWTCAWSSIDGTGGEGTGTGSSPCTW